MARYAHDKKDVAGQLRRHGTPELILGRPAGIKSAVSFSVTG